MHANNVNHFAIHADDVERAKSFYSNVFSWRFEEWGPPDFYLISTGNEEFPGIRGALQKREQPLGAGCNGYECSIAVENIKEITESIVGKWRKDRFRRNRDPECRQDRQVLRHRGQYRLRGSIRGS